MTTILHITPAYKPAYIYGGPTFSVSRLCEELNKTDLSVIVITTNANGSTDLNVETDKPLKIANVPVHYCKRITGDHTHFSPALMRKFIAIIKKSKAAPDNKLIVHIHSWWNTVAIFSAIIARIYGLPVVVSPRGVLTPYSMTNRSRILKAIIHQILSKPLLRKCHVHATTEIEVADLQQIALSPKKVYVIPNLPTFKLHFQQHRKLQDASETLKIIFLSRIEEKKGLDLLLKALSLVRIKWQLTIAGEGRLDYINDLTRYALELGIYKSISWVDGIYGQAKFDYISEHDFMILPSYNENFANVILESLAVGTPVIITNAVGLSNYVFKNKLGWLITHEPENIASVIEKAAMETQERKRIRREAPEQIRKDFKEKDLIAAYVNMYKTILNNES